MAELMDIYQFRQPTVLHGIDARIKLAAMAALSLATLAAGPRAMILATALVVMGAALLGRTALSWVLRLKYFGVILVAVMVVRAMTTPGDMLVQWHFIALSWPGLVDGAMFAWRLLVIVWLSLLTTATTAADDIRNAVQWVLRAVAFGKGQIISDMIMLLVRFMPMILIHSQQVANAQNARLVACRKNPYYRLRVYGMALLRRIFLQSEQLSYAMAARSYNFSRVVTLRPLKRADLLAAVLIVLVCLTLLLI